jgi:hypothetical protein
MLAVGQKRSFMPRPVHISAELPAQRKPFINHMRIYMPKPEVLNGTWKQPLLQRIR